MNFTLPSSASTGARRAAPVSLSGGESVMVVRGISDDTDVVIAADLNTMADEKPPMPKVLGLARHPKLAYTVSKLLEPPHGTWQQEAERFFAFATKRPSVPQSMRGRQALAVDQGAV